MFSAAGAVPAVVSPPAARVSASFAAPRLMHRLAGQTMGTSWSVSLVGSPTAPVDALRGRIEHALGLVVDQMSNWEPASDLSRFNAAPAGQWCELPAELFEVVCHGLDLARRSGGSYDPSVGALVAAWGFGPAARRGVPPADGEIERALARTGWQRLKLDVAARRLLQPGGVALDLSGIAKGYAVDLVSRELAAAGYGDTLVEIGGELKARGRRADGQPWRVAVDAWPAAARATAAAEAGSGTGSNAGSGTGSGTDSGTGGGAHAESSAPVIALDGAIATSGDAWHAFVSDGRRHSHTIDPRSGRTVSDALASVTVVHEQCMHADALATALTVLGPIDGYDYACRHGLAAAFVRRGADGPETLLTAPFAALLA
ncbi:MAG: FAD:protein FMN transferase [Burkholderiaceae bacterium]